MPRRIVDPELEGEIEPLFEGLDEEEKVKLAEIALAKKAASRERTKKAYHKDRPAKIQRARRDRALLRLAAKWYEEKVSRAKDEQRNSRASDDRPGDGDGSEGGL